MTHASTTIIYNIIHQSSSIQFSYNWIRLFRINYHQYEWVNGDLNEEDLLVLSNVKKDNIHYLAQLTEWPETYDELRVYDKLDGSMMNVSVYNNELICTSSGSIDGTYPQLFKKALELHLGSKLDSFKQQIKNKTIVFEYINSALDTHVVLYDKPDLVLLGGFDHVTGQDLEFTNIFETCCVSVCDLFEINENKHYIKPYNKGH